MKFMLRLKLNHEKNKFPENSLYIKIGSNGTHSGAFLKTESEATMLCLFI